MAVHRFVIKNDLTEGSPINEVGDGALSFMAEMNKIEHLYTGAFGGYGAAQVKELKKSVEDTEMILVGDWSGGHEDKRRIDRIFGVWETLYRVQERLRNIRSIINERENLRRRRRRSNRLKMVKKMAMYGGGVAAAAAVILVCNFARKKNA
ncbi:hypothetical protein PVL29_013174 [Vitis rotundifolia]|uniref:Uncharacterized protein n=1 Tax=Vitis rotundifolia TaxID=103349 RepID=A0AA38ZKZ9_VITRO|nr:hypothetical protein PVL29_013174 [Vitis rotundifolia]